MGEELGQAFAQAVETILAAPGRVIISGMGKSGHVGRKIAATMASTGTPAHFVHPGEASHGDLGMIQPDDVILAMSWSGESSELADIIAYARHNDVKLIGITSRADSSLGVGAHICLCLPKAKEACPNGLAPTTSTTMQLALGDALAVALLESRGFTSQDFRRYHPGGKLGAQLRQVSAVMHTGDRLPLIQLGKMMSEAIVTISSKGLGCVIVVNSDSKLGGLVTDGDLRRHMAPDLLGRSVDEIMTKSPKTVTPDTLIAEALEIMESRKISSLVVVEDERPVGLIHILDLLRIGAA
ncbi:MAG: KpsF/GutQ family sugar-phosphate isomerase [Alphaproteobacteria bacterium]|nr:KpsF/GutQ family sugar-phosphate isomerase [Alphaproteobacteria bacterium]